jgi:hypothetical protein
MSRSVRKVAAAEIRAAKKWLNRRKITTEEISPRQFAKVAKELNKGFNETLKVLAGEQTGGQV